MTYVDTSGCGTCKKCYYYLLCMYMYVRVGGEVLILIPIFLHTCTKEEIETQTKYTECTKYQKLGL